MIEVMDVQETEETMRRRMILSYNNLIDGCHTFSGCKGCPICDKEDGCLIVDDRLPERWKRLGGAE